MLRGCTASLFPSSMLSHPNAFLTPPLENSFSKLNPLRFSPLHALFAARYNSPTKQGRVRSPQTRFYSRTLHFQTRHRLFPTYSPAGSTPSRRPSPAAGGNAAGGGTERTHRSRRRRPPPPCPPHMVQPSRAGPRHAMPSCGSRRSTYARSARLPEPGTLLNAPTRPGPARPFPEGGPRAAKAAGPPPAPGSAATEAAVRPRAGRDPRALPRHCAMATAVRRGRARLLRKRRAQEAPPPRGRGPVPGCRAAQVAATALGSRPRSGKIDTPSYSAGDLGLPSGKHFSVFLNPLLLRAARKRVLKVLTASSNGSP